MNDIVKLWLLSVFVITCIASWITHVIVCISEEIWGLLIAGAIVFPVGMIHGIGKWFGA